MGRGRRLGDALGEPARARAIPPIGRTRPSHLKLSIAAYSYRDYLTGKKSQPLDLFEFVNLAADMGLDGVEPTSYYFPARCHGRLPQPAQASRLHCWVWTSPGRPWATIFAFRQAAQAGRADRQVLRWIDRAAELDAPVIRIFAGNVPKGSTEDQAVGWADRGDQGRAAPRRRERDRAGTRESRRDHQYPRADPQAGRRPSTHRTSA